MRDALMLSATTKRDVLRAEKYREAMRVVFSTMEIAATFHRNATVTKSHGVAKAVGELARGRAAITARTVAAEVLVLRNVSARGRLSPSDGDTTHRHLTGESRGVRAARRVEARRSAAPPHAAGGGLT